jgi:hypothetical protein
LPFCITGTEDSFWKTNATRGKSDVSNALFASIFRLVGNFEIPANEQYLVRSVLRENVVKRQ